MMKNNLTNLSATEIRMSFLLMNDNKWLDFRERGAPHSGIFPISGDRTGSQNPFFHYTNEQYTISIKLEPLLLVSRFEYRYLSIDTVSSIYTRKTYNLPF
jgi:hypothetical protein